MPGQAGEIDGLESSDGNHADQLERNMRFHRGAGPSPSYGNSPTGFGDTLISSSPLAHAAKGL